MYVYINIHIHTYRCNCLYMYTIYAVHVRWTVYMFLFKFDILKISCVYVHYTQFIYIMQLYILPCIYYLLYTMYNYCILYVIHVATQS